MVVKNLLAMFFVFGAINIMFGQTPVRWSFDKKNVAGNEVELQFTAQVQGGWYIYSQNINEGGPIPTSITFDPANVEVIGTASEKGNKVEGFDAAFNMNIIKYQGTVTFEQKVKVKDPSKPIKGYLTFMTCDKETCLPPADVDFTIQAKN